MIYITGDIHGSIDIGKLCTDEIQKNDTEGYYVPDMVEGDYLIICGDFGLIWSREEDELYPDEQYWLDFLANRPYTTLFIDGNHENFDLLDAYPVSEWHGGKVHFIRDEKIIHLMRGQVFEIDGMTFFTMGGASSHDIQYRIEGRSWWRRELPSAEEYEEAVKNLAAHGNKVDFIVTHCAPLCIQRELEFGYAEDELVVFLEKEVMRKVRFRLWFNGHYHIDEDLDRNIILYDAIIPVTLKDRN